MKKNKKLDQLITKQFLFYLTEVGLRKWFWEGKVLFYHIKDSRNRTNILYLEIIKWCNADTFEEVHSRVLFLPKI